MWHKFTAPKFWPGEMLLQLLSIWRMISDKQNHCSLDLMQEDRKKKTAKKSHQVQTQQRVRTRSAVSEAQNLTWPSSPRLHKGLSSHPDWLWVEQPQLSLINQESVSQPATADLNLSCTVRCCRVDAHSSHFMMSTSEVVFVRLHLIGRRENVFTFLILAKRKCASISWCSKNRNNTRFSFFHRVL